MFRSSKHIYAQVIDDDSGRTLAAASTLEKDLRGKLKTGADRAAAEQVGKLIAERAKAAGVRPWCSIAAAISTMAASRRSPRARARSGWRSSRGQGFDVMKDN